jgi:hypothetical protein
MGRGGRRDFAITADCTSTRFLDKLTLDTMVRDFSGLKDDLHLDIMDVRVHKFKQDVSNE